ncbi:S-layer homology domain-containing protein [Fictibacillus phosphorivorans]|uniref:S-layer homology domain-containing protein n=1 Tax=Fictibacillus phosphorivorans TaxID=1221500 RepID=UPI00204072CA|nr:S-layer homology domain-containing protein [Fictibacillus phosphorivorans]MCM3718495.1 S-layer homology domain-containing protein [Fictibacillus phosphorivorans]MCM3776149.1 S-layer homology domain-containing protein [Fictibacillus phosphorivorans]
MRGKRITKKAGAFLALVLAGQAVLGTGHTYASEFINGQTVREFKLSKAATFKEVAYHTSKVNQDVFMIETKIGDPNTQIKVGVPNPISSLMTVSKRAKLDNRAGHYVVGAVNASFFRSNDKYGFAPTGILSQNNKIVNYGVVTADSTSPMNIAVGFGIGANGEPIIDYTRPKLSFGFNGKTLPLYSMNSVREGNTGILYTKENKLTTSGTNEWGTEIVITNASKDPAQIGFGDTITGTVSEITRMTQPGDRKIPTGGMIVSFAGKDFADQLSSLKKGDTVSVSADIETKWKDAKFILGSGPLLVRNGKVEISMSANDYLVKDRAPRTVVAYDADYKKLFFIVNDGRSRASSGSSLTAMANYLISLGADYAMNLDGGGSSAMVARTYGAYEPVLMNTPSDGGERAVSSILEVVNTAPIGTAGAAMLVLGSAPNKLEVGMKTAISLKYALDENYNPMNLSAPQLTWKVEGGVGVMEGNTFVAKAEGKGTIVASMGGASARIPVTVTNSNPIPAGTKYLTLESFNSLTNWGTQTARSKVALSTDSYFAREGSSAKVDYDFTNSGGGTAAAYLEAKTAIPVNGKPASLGIWAYNDGSGHWLRGEVIDVNGQTQRIDFTEPGGMTWKGWGYSEAKLNANLAFPIKFKQLYFAETDAAKHNKGTIYFDKLQAVYDASYVEPAFTDLDKASWAKSSIVQLTKQSIISGYPNGKFGPNDNITRLQAATMISKQMKLKTSNVKNPGFADVTPSTYGYGTIAAVASIGAMNGFVDGTFRPDATLSRGEMASIIERAYDLKGTTTKSFSDVKKGYWAYQSIQTVLANGITGGYTDGTFRPNNPITRAEFSSMLDRYINK